MTGANLAGRARRAAREILLQVALLLASVAAIELILVLAHPKYLFPEETGVSGLGFRYDAELGWSPIPGAKSQGVENNSLGTRDSEPEGSRPTILFIGDSMVWGFGVETGERFTDLLKPRFPAHQVVNAGVAGYGTDQEYLFLRRLWDATRPAIVVLTFCQANDRNDNRHSLRYNFYKPYLEETAPGTWQFRGQPPPQSRRVYIHQSWAGRNFLIGRLAISFYVELRHRRVTVPDPTERLVGMIRDYVHGNAAILLVGIQDRDVQLEDFLTREKIPFVNLEAPVDPHSRHWTAEGHVIVADRYAALLAGHGALRALPGSDTKGVTSSAAPAASSAALR